jgi:hypothetical protein
MPIRGIATKECPLDPLDSQSTLDVTIFGNIHIIVIVDEFALINPPECCKGSSYQENGYD